MVIFSSPKNEECHSSSRPENLLGQVLVVAGGGEGTGNTKDDDLLALQGADVQVLGDSAGVLQRGIVGAIFGWRLIN